MLPPQDNKFINKTKNSNDYVHKTGKQSNNTITLINHAAAHAEKRMDGTKAQKHFLNLVLFLKNTLIQLTCCACWFC